jgi:N-acetylated-alpha-linked acidic dipeptidase
MRSVLIASTLAAVALATVASVAPYSERRSEATFLRIPSSDGARASSQVINQGYHYAGTLGDYRLAAYMRDAMRGFGLRAWIEAFPATVYTPRVLQLQLLTSPVITFELHDQKIAADPDGSRPDAGLPFNAGSGNGDVRAPVVYVSRGLDADYATLAGASVSVRGRIVLIQYGAEYRGNLAARAQANGAAGVIFYSDPKNDGFSRGLVYPNGPYRPTGVVQRGDVMGDDHRPLHIPTLPVTGVTAQRLLAEMRGAPGPAGWAGALPVRYRVGVTQALIRLHVEMNARPTTLWNTVGELTGAKPEQIVVLGGHRDAWVYGVSDDGSGISTLLEVARGLGALHRDGWMPRRTIRIAGWDAEEIGELGSAAYVAMHRTELRSGCIAYINTDESASGPTFGAAAAGALLTTATPVVQQVLHITKPRIDVPAGGSDFESFIYALGTPILDLGYAGPLGTYHSPYDDFRFASLYADPGFVHHKTIAQTIGIVAMRLAQSDRPFKFGPYAAALDSGARETAKEASHAGLVLDSAGLANAINLVEGASHRADANQQAQNIPVALRAAQQLDLIAYSANGYASVAFPTIASAIASRKQAELDTAMRQTIASLERVEALLRQMGT